MEPSFRDLPPSKRFKLLQDVQATPIERKCLPVKKRGEILVPTPTVQCLPAKKRIWAPFNPWVPVEAGDSDEEEKEVIEERFQEEEDDDDVFCAVCRSTDGNASDPIVFCDGCDLMVHASCYGKPLVEGIPEGDWYCARCLRGDKKTSCCLCPTQGGAVKPTTDRQWAHITCALLVPEVFFQDPDGRDGIDCSHIPTTLWGKTHCYLCKSNEGCALQCAQSKCVLGFHVSCGLDAGLSIEFQEGKNGAVVAGFCGDHTKLWIKQQETGKYKIVARDGGLKSKK